MLRIMIIQARVDLRNSQRARPHHPDLVLALATLLHLPQENDFLVKSVGRHSLDHTTGNGTMKHNICLRQWCIVANTAKKSSAGMSFFTACHTFVGGILTDCYIRADSLKRHLDNGCDEMP